MKRALRLQRAGAGAITQHDWWTVLRMKQVQLATPGGLSNLRYGSAAVPEPGPGQVLVRVAASSLNYHDLLVAEGAIPVADGRVILSDGAGVVEALGAGVTRWQPGDAVMSVCFHHWQQGRPTREQLRFVGEHDDGFASEYVAVSEDALTAVPAGYSLAEAATLPCAGLTAWRALVTEGRLQAGESVLVQGTGGVSVFALQFARAAGARVIATSSSDEKLEKMRQLGADELINYRSTPEWGKEVLRRTGQQGVDHVIEVGGASTFRQSVVATRMGGHIAMIGILSGASGEINLPSIFYKQIRISGIAMASRAVQEEMVAHLGTSQVRPLISDEFPLRDIAAAFAHQRAQKHVGKISIAC